MTMTTEKSSTPRQSTQPSFNHEAPLKVCHLSMTLQTGGLERLLVDFSRFHDSSRFSLSFVALDALGSPAEDLKAAGFPVHSIGFSTTGKTKGLTELRNYLCDEKIDILHTHNTYPHFYGAMAARWGGIGTIINTQHGRGCGSGWKSLWQFRIANRLTARIVGVSEDAAQLCRQQDPGSASKMTCIWNGIDVDRFAFHGPRPAPVAISVARLSPEKDFATLLRAVKRVVVVQPNFRLQLVGDGTERNRLEALVKELKIESHVDFLGERKDVPELLKNAGFFVSSSRTEGISLTLLEAMAVGLPIVTTRVGGNPEIVMDGVTGKLVPSEDPNALASAMLDMINESDTWSSIGQMARLRVEQNFSVRNMVQNYEQLYTYCTSVRDW